MSEEHKVENEYVIVRGVPVPDTLINKLGHTFGAKLVDDREIQLLSTLDKELHKFRMTNNRDLKDNEFIEIFGETHRFKPVNLPVPLKLFIPGVGYTIEYAKKPIWFRIPKIWNL